MNSVRKWKLWRVSHDFIANTAALLYRFSQAQKPNSWLFKVIIRFVSFNLELIFTRVGFSSGSYNFSFLKEAVSMCDMSNMSHNNTCNTCFKIALLLDENQNLHHCNQYLPVRLKVVSFIYGKIKLEPHFELVSFTGVYFKFSFSHGTPLLWVCLLDSPWLGQCYTCLEVKGLTEPFFPFIVRSSLWRVIVRHCHRSGNQWQFYRLIIKSSAQRHLCK